MATADQQSSEPPAEIVVSCRELDPNLAFFTERLGLRVATIFPAESPQVAVVVGRGLRLRLETGSVDVPVTIRFPLAEPDGLIADGPLVAPNGTTVVPVPATRPLTVPPLAPSLVISRLADGDEWTRGRAGMGYRDLIPDRQGGRFIASHITIDDAGPVADYVHFHKIRFQLIFVRRGWVRLVYEDQGDPFVLEAGDCVLQPPEIRHRVLESSAGLEVIELGCPAEHETHGELTLELPTGRSLPERDYGGQLFVRHHAAGARWTPDAAGFLARDVGIAAATDGLADVRVVRPDGGTTLPRRHDGELSFGFLLDGSAILRVAGNSPAELEAGDAFVVPPGIDAELSDCSASLELLQVRLPAGG